MKTLPMIVPALRKNFSPRKAHSAGWLRFAEAMINKAGIVDDRTAENLLNAFAAVPRDRFVESGLALRALEDISLPIGFGQSISKPSTVARMLALVGIEPGMRILEVGCGSGYCSAVMAAAGAQVFTIESLGLLAQKTRKLLDLMDYQNVLVRRGDGRRGWSEHAPYDAIVVSAPFSSIEPELLEQLVAPGGRLVAPIGTPQSQVLTLWEVKPTGTVMYQLEPCNFVEGH